MSGIYKNQIDKMRWSYSRASSFDTCPYSFYLAYIVKDDDLYLPEGNYYAEVGSFVHEILEKIFKKELTLEEASQYYADHYDEHINYEAKKSTMEKTYELCANYFAELDLDWLKDYEILGVELKCRFEIEGYDFVGYIDLLLRDLRDGEIIVVDHKSSQYPLKKDGTVKKSCEHSFEGYKHQMSLYCYQIKKMYGKFPKEIWWNHFKENKFVKIPFNIDDYNDAVMWFMKTVHKIENEQDFNAKQDFFYCNNLCDFRNSCEIAIEEKKKYRRSKFRSRK